MKIKTLTAALAVLLGSVPAAYAGNIAFGSTEALAGAHAGQLAGETISIGNGSTVFMDMNGNTSGNPVYVIFAVPNTSSGVPNITSATMYDTGSNPSTLTGVLTDTVSIANDGMKGTLGPGQNVYSVIGLAGNNSLNFPNLSGWDSTYLGLTPTSFTLYEWTLTGADPFDSKTDAVISFNTGGIPLGSFVAGWDHGTDTPFTVAGFDRTPPRMPEPTSLLLLGSGLLTFGSVLRRVKLQYKAA